MNIFVCYTWFRLSTNKEGRMTTSKRIASKAGKKLGSKKGSKDDRAIEGSAVSQAKRRKKAK